MIYLSTKLRRIESDQRRFKEIIEGKVRENLKQYISNSDGFFGKVGKDKVHIPINTIDLPRFRFGRKEGIGQGDGDLGDQNNPGNDGDPAAGDKEGDHSLEIEYTVDDLARILGEELKLPNIQPKGNKTIDGEKNRVRGIKKQGINSMRVFKKGMLNAIKRSMSLGNYHPGQVIVPIKEDMRYRSFKPEPKPYYSAVIIYMMDVSGSMGEEQKKIVRTTGFWLSAWLNQQYKGVEERFIIHDMKAREVSRKDFFMIKESGGTQISSAYQLCLDMILKNYPSEDYNIYPFHFSDGDNWKDDDENAVSLLEKLLPRSNVFCYGQCLGLGGSEGHFMDGLERKFKLKDKAIREISRLRVANLYKGENIPEALREFMKTGR